MVLNEEQLAFDIVNLKSDVSEVKETMITKTEYRHMLGLLEGIASDIKTIKEDHTFAIEWLKRIQDHVDRQERDIQAIKLKLQIA